MTQYQRQIALFIVWPKKQVLSKLRVIHRSSLICILVIEIPIFMTHLSSAILKVKGQVVKFD